MLGSLERMTAAAAKDNTRSGSSNSRNIQWQQTVPEPPIIAIICKSIIEGGQSRGIRRP